MIQVIDAEDRVAWRATLSAFERVDVCHLPEYHAAYSARFEGARALMWCYKTGNHEFSNPFLLSPVIIAAEQGKVVTDYYDISSVYGYSGPLSTSANRAFLDDAWEKFDQWAVEQCAVSEFTRFSTYANNVEYAHPQTAIEYNRPVALALLPDTYETHYQQLSGKTRNMIRKARRENIIARELPLEEGLEEFRSLYRDTMARNRATEFFAYDDDYYKTLTQLPQGELVLVSACQDQKMVAAAIILIHKNMAFYHLGASTLRASQLGAGNLVLFEAATKLIERNVSYFSVGGGRTISSDDPLFRFKKSNATSVGEFYIGKRLIQEQAQQSIVKQWQSLNNSTANSSVLQFYRQA